MYMESCHDTGGLQHWLHACLQQCDLCSIVCREYLMSNLQGLFDVYPAGTVLRRALPGLFDVYPA